MASSRDRAICLRTHRFSETSQILTLFCRRTGIIRALAKGAHRRTKAGASSFDGGADLLDVGDCVFITHASRELATLTEWKLIEGHLGLRTNLRAMLIGQHLAEVISLLLGEHDPHPLLFDRLRVTLPALSTPRIEEEFVAMQIDILKDAGFLPDFRDPADEALSRIDPRLVRIAETIQKLPRERNVPQRLPRLSRAQTDPLTAYFSLHVQTITQRPLHTAKSVIR
jgi:recombinational DNA repair protein (RecF pathway)